MGRYSKRFSSPPLSSPEVKKKLFLYVEGERTEYSYFQHLLERYEDRGIEFHIIPENNIQKIEDELKENENYMESIDSCYIIQDYDRYEKEHYKDGKDEYKELQRRIRKIKRNIIFSNPSFEYTIYLHLCKTHSSKKMKKDKDMICSKIQTIMSEDYNKNMAKSTKNYDYCYKIPDFFTKKIQNVRAISSEEIRENNLTEKTSEFEFKSYPSFSMISVIFDALDALSLNYNDRSQLKTKKNEYEQ